MVDYDVKCSFHTSGAVHFSKSGESERLPGRQGFPMNGPNGRLFEFRAYGLDGFEPVDLGVVTKDYRVLLRFPVHPPSIIVSGEWLTKTSIAANAEGHLVGPNPIVVRRLDGISEPGVLVGQPRGFPLREHVIVLKTTVIPHAAGISSPTAIFIGGWDAHDGAAPVTSRMLAFMYPYLGEAVATSSGSGKAVFGDLATDGRSPADDAG